jgi:hypothetical protein
LRNGNFETAFEFIIFHFLSSQTQDENRYHEDIFGITLRTAEIHNKSRETAKIKMESQQLNIA